MEDSDFEIGDEVVINATGQKAEVKDFTRDGKVIVTLDSSGRDVTLSEDDIDAWSDLDHGKGQDDGDEDDGEGNVAQDEFYVAVYDEREERSWIGMVTKRSGTKWHEKPFKGKPDYRWGSSYMSYLEPEQVMQWIRKDYARGYDIEGPFASATEAQEYVSNHFGGDMDGQAEVNESGWLKRGIGTKRDVRLDEVRGAMVEAELGWLSASLNEGRTKNPDGTYTDSHTGRRYKGPTGNDGNDSYMDDDYMRKFYTDRLAKIEAGPYKYPKEVAQIKAKLAKLGVKESVDSGTDKQWEMLIGSNKTKRFLAKDVAEATRIARKAGATSVIRLSKNLTRIGLPIKLKESSQIAQEALTMGGALKRELSKPEPGSKLDMKIKKHNSLVSSGQKGLFDTPPDGFKFKKDGTLTLEGVVDVVKKGIKSVKRGMSGWDKNSVGPGGEKTADPVDIVKRNKSYDDETVLRLAKTADFGFPFGKDGKSGDKTPRGLQRKVLDREIKKRGLDVKEGKDFGDFEEWKKAVLLAYPTQANKMKFKGRIEGGKQTVSAEVPGEDRSYGVWDMDEENGVVLSEGVSPFKPNAKVKIVGGPADVRDKEGYIGEIKTDAQGKKTFVVDISDGSAKATQSVTLQPKDVRLVRKVKESVTIEAGWLKEAFAKKQSNTEDNMKLQELYANDAKDEVVVKVHKAFPGKIQAAKADLEKMHNGGRDIKTSQSGDYVNLHVPAGQHNNAASVEKTMQANGHADHHAYGGVHQNGQRVTEGRVKDAMLDLVEKAVTSVQADTSLSYDDDKNEFCMAVAKKVIDMDQHELFAGNRSEAYEWVKDYMSGL